MSSRKKINEETKRHFKEEIELWKAEILGKRMAILKAESQAENIQKSIELSIGSEQNKILAAQAKIAELSFDFINEVTLLQLKSLAEKEKREIVRMEKNIEVRRREIDEGEIVLDRNEKARASLLKKNEEDH